MEIGESLANKLGIAQGDTVKVSSNRGYIKAKAVVTKRISHAESERQRYRYHRYSDSLGL